MYVYRIKFVFLLCLLRIYLFNVYNIKIREFFYMAKIKATFMMLKAL